MVLDFYPCPFWPAIILLGWLLGAVLQIAEGILGTVARLRDASPADAVCGPWSGVPCVFGAQDIATLLKMISILTRR